MKRILEYSEFELQSNGTPTNYFVKDPQLSYDPFSSFVADTRSANLMLNQIVKGILDTNDFFDLRSNTVVNIFSLKDLKILRMYYNDHVNLDVYINFGFEDETYFGVIKNFNHENFKFETELFNSNYISKEFKIKIGGLIVKAIKKWLNAESGNYIALKDFRAINIISGKDIILKTGTLIKVTLSTDNEIFFEFNEIEYRISGIDYYYFNYFFKIQTKPL